MLSKNLKKFIWDTNKLKDVNRAVNGSVGRLENAAEHSWSVGMMCWLLAGTLEKEFGKKLDLNKMIKMALMHDLVEIVVGDASIFDPVLRKKKEAKEDKAARKFFSTLPPALKKEFTSLWTEFEALKTLEAKTVRAMDKISGVIQRMITKQAWHDVKGTTSHLDSLLADKLVFSQTLMNYYEELKKEAVKKRMIKKT